MDGGSRQAGSSAETPASAARRPRGRFARVGSILASALLVFVFAEIVLQPLRSRDFLRLSDNQAALEPYGQAFGVAVAACLVWLFGKSRHFEARRSRLRLPSQKEGFRWAVGGLCILGFGLGWFSVVSWVPLVQHHFAPKSTVEIPFKLTGSGTGRPCRGVRATNPRFDDD